MIVAGYGQWRARASDALRVFAGTHLRIKEFKARKMLNWPAELVRFALIINAGLRPRNSEN